METRKAGIWLAAVALLVCGSVVWAQSATPWIHIEVSGKGEDATNVKVDLPLSLIEVAMDIVPDKVLEKGRLKMEKHGVSVAGLRRLWAEFRNTGDAELVRVDDPKKDQHVRIVREAGIILISVQSLSGKEKKVRIEIPIAVVDALLEGDGENLNIAAAVRQLRGESGDIVRVEDGDKLVRIWIDQSRKG